MPLISVIVPVYKVEPYLRECVDSILNQTFTDFELILVDDGSPDNCPAICDEYAKKDKRVTVIHKENGGLSSARNAGLDYIFANSSFEYIAFIDSDDFVSCDYLTKLLNAINGNDLSVCCYNIFGDNNNDNTSFLIKDAVIDKYKYWSLSDDFVFRIVAWNKLYSRKLFDGLRYEFGKIQEDEFIIHQLIWRCKSISIISDQLYNYRKRCGSIMSDVDLNSLENHKLFLEIYTKRMLFYNSVDNDFLNYYMITFNLCLKLYIDYGYLDKEAFHQLKKIYILKKRKNYKGNLTERFFLNAPRIYKLIRKIKKFDKFLNLKNKLL